MWGMGQSEPIGLLARLNGEIDRLPSCRAVLGLTLTETLDAKRFSEKVAVRAFGGAGTNRTSNYYGGWAGARQNWVPNASCTASSDQWQTGTTCLRWAPNSKFEHAGNGHPYRNNTIINSFHTGGVFILLTDGSVRFASDNVDFQTLKKLAMRNDGQPVGEF